MIKGGFRNKWKAKRDILDKHSKEVNKIIMQELPEIQRDARQSVLDLDVFETGRIYRNTTARTELRKNPKVIRFITSGNGLTNSVGEFYPVFPYKGLGTSAKYGSRPWLKLAASKTIQRLGLRKGGLPNASSTFQKPQTIARRGSYS